MAKIVVLGAGTGGTGAAFVAIPPLFHQYDA